MCPGKTLNSTMASRRGGGGGGGGGDGDYDGGWRRR